MSSDTTLKKLGLTKVPKEPKSKKVDRVDYYGMRSPSPDTLKEIREFYGDAVQIDIKDNKDWSNGGTDYTYVTCELMDEKGEHLCTTHKRWGGWVHLTVADGWSFGKAYTKYFYSWTGGSVVVSDTLIPIADFRAALREKMEELRKGKEKRNRQVRDVMDVVRLTLEDRGIKWCRGNNGTIRISANQTEDGRQWWLSQLDMNRASEVEMNFSVGTHEIGLGLHVADPEFEPKFNRIIDNWMNLAETLTKKY